MIEKAKATDREEIIKFIDGVFSENFATLHPKLYNEKNVQSIDNHYIIREDAVIKACLCMEQIELDVKGHVLKGGVIGSVSVCPSTRGKGYMTMLMENVVSEARQKGYDFLALYGDKHRYRNFGFEPYGCAIIAKFISANKKLKNCNFEYKKIDACLDFMYERYNKKNVKIARDRKRFFDILKTWRSDVYLVLQNGKEFGYLVHDGKNNLIEEVVAKDKSKIVDIILNFNFETVNYEFFSDDFDLIPDLKNRCESLSVTDCCNINILNENTVNRLFEKNSIYGIEFSNMFIPRIDNI